MIGHVKFTWQRFIILAEKYMETDNEVMLRTGISRAYYGAFHKASDFLKSINQTVNIYRAGSHDFVIKTFADIGKIDADYRQVANDLQRLKERRIRADYHDVYFRPFEKNGDLKRELSLTIELARRIVLTVDRIIDKER